jgi:hypothetical protein
MGMWLLRMHLLAHVAVIMEVPHLAIDLRKIRSDARNGRLCVEHCSTSLNVNFSTG